ncbi:MAG: hypothetical protein OES09_07445 [Gammaproteobacteria bacterium]|nr:hypothetical protein [Gammaproteobacteria bacterium]
MNDGATTIHNNLDAFSESQLYVFLNELRIPELTELYQISGDGLASGGPQI